MDLIGRQAAIEHLKKRLYETALNNDAEHPYYEEMADNMVSVWLGEVPTIDPVKHGKWLKLGDCGTVQCSECFDDFDYIDGLCYLCHGQELPNYCPNCGAKMEGSEDDG